ncbi:unnamed protein product [Acanthosepion pharaonis]|uniref:Uncharacterized protein n=1 Tax=Acanthosepion pharaonis TaxID=158019 RepID=A0A812E0W6_ACAPH|nr:unnamed protein product [Sepia pharaonis]
MTFSFYTEDSLSFPFIHFILHFTFDFFRYYHYRSLLSFTSFAVLFTVSFSSYPYPFPFQSLLCIFTFRFLSVLSFIDLFLFSLICISLKVSSARILSFLLFTLLSRISFPFIHYFAFYLRFSSLLYPFLSFIHFCILLSDFFWYYFYRSFYLFNTLYFFLLSLQLVSLLSFTTLHFSSDFFSSYPPFIHYPFTLSFHSVFCILDPFIFHLFCIYRYCIFQYLHPFLSLLNILSNLPFRFQHFARDHGPFTFTRRQAFLFYCLSFSSYHFLFLSLTTILPFDFSRYYHYRSLFSSFHFLAFLLPSLQLFILPFSLSFHSHITLHFTLRFLLGITIYRSFLSFTFAGELIQKSLS